MIGIGKLHVTMALFATLSVSATASASSIVVCPATEDPAIERIRELLENRPITVADPRSSVALCKDPPRLIFDETLRKADVKLRVPIASLNHAPLTVEQFIGQIDSVKLPAPWAMGETTWSIEDGFLVITAKDAKGAAWRAEPANLQLTLKSGQFLIAELPSSRLIVDDTAANIARLEGNIDAKESQLAWQRETAAVFQKMVDDPSSIATAGDAQLASERAILADAEAALPAARATAQAAFASASNFEKFTAYSSLETRVPAVNRSEVEILNRRHLVLLNDRNATPAQLAAVRAEIDAVVARLGMGDTLLAYFNPAFSEALNAAVIGRRVVASLEQSVENNRQQRLADARRFLADSPAEVETLEAAIAAIKKELASGTPFVRDVPTTHGAVCPTT